MKIWYKYTNTKKKKKKSITTKKSNNKNTDWQRPNGELELLGTLAISKAVTFVINPGSIFPYLLVASLSIYSALYSFVPSVYLISNIIFFVVTDLHGPGSFINFPFHFHSQVLTSYDLFSH